MPESQHSTVHVLVPKMELASQEDVKKLLEKFGISLKNLPRIKITDPSLIPIGPKVGDVVKITRSSPATGGDSIYYRLVVE